MRKLLQNMQKASNQQASLMNKVPKYSLKALKYFQNIYFPGESWLGLETIHQITSVRNYSLHITLKDFDNQTYVAVYDQFEVFM